LIVVALVSERMWLWALPLLPGLALSGSRGAWLALAVGLASMHVRRVWIFGFLGAACVFFLVRPLSPSDAVRLSIWDGAFHMLTWLGWGPGSFFSWMLPYGGSNIYPEYAHNDALQLAFEYGMGAAIPIGILGFAFCRADVRERPILAAFTVAGLCSMPLYIPVCSFLAWVVAGHAVRRWALARRNRPDWGLRVAAWHKARTANAGGTPISVVAGS